ncbi:hypothetical protein UFOVP217_13 [uncultured Caudovirales phage]|uniref:Uncharacterized protein n=1 Tax=uncultured Caudovirales phage TaxID=2100421 RepID=A0A6J7WKY9_9CAUD|nr:hypothetical protein UFOVP217_13 [uncultured Caudovirales phage]
MGKVDNQYIVQAQFIIYDKDIIRAIDQAKDIIKALPNQAVLKDMIEIKSDDNF